MVVVVVSSEVPPSLGGIKPSPSSQYPTQKYVVYSGDAPQYLDSGCSDPGGSAKDSDSDESIDHSSGRGSGTDIISEVDRLSVRLEDSGLYSADGDSLLQSSPSFSQSSSPLTYDEPSQLKLIIRKTSTEHHQNLTNNALRNHQYQLDHPQPHSLPSEQLPHHYIQPPHYTSLEPHRRPPRTYLAVDAPICTHCARMDVTFFDPSCGGCWSLLKRVDTSPSHVFAVLRQWVPQVQKAVHLLVNMALTVGCGLSDRDSLTDMTLLHYAVKAGSLGVGDPGLALQVVEELVDQGADVHQRCKWTHMTALHYAAYFDVAPVLQLLLSLPQGVNVDDPCSEYDLGTPLHMAAANLCLGAAHVLLIHGASRMARDARGRTPKECIPLKEQYDLVPDVQKLIMRFTSLLSSNFAHPQLSPGPSGASPTGSVSGKAVLQALGLKLGDRVLVSGVKTGTLRYVGPTEFSTGLWAGIELETPTGRHNGCVKGVMYFRCGHNYGIFVPVNRLTKIPNVNGGYNSNTTGRSRRRGRMPSTQRRSTSREPPPSRRSLSLPPGKVNHGRVDVSKVSSRIRLDINNTTRKLVVGDRVIVDMGLGCGGARAAMGVVRYTGAVHFASGYWIGVELDDPRGANDGKIQGNRYFTCRIQHGVMAVPSRVIKIDGDTDMHSLPIVHPENSSRTTSRSVSRNPSERPHPYEITNSKLRPSSKSPSKHKKSSSIQHQPNMSRSYHEVISNDINNYGNHEDSSLLDSMKRTISLKNAFYPPNTSMTNLNRSFSARYESARMRQDAFARRKEEASKEPKWYEAPILTQPSRQSRDDDQLKHWLEIGHNVFYKNMIGIIKYIGYVHFEDGKWIGIELRERKGRHDGKVQGQRYFWCKVKHGLMVRPNKVTVRGLNGADLVKPDDFEDYCDE